MGFKPSFGLFPSSKSKVDVLTSLKSNLKDFQYLRSNPFTNKLRIKFYFCKTAKKRDLSPQSRLFIIQRKQVAPKIQCVAPPFLSCGLIYLPFSTALGVVEKLKIKLCLIQFVFKGHIIAAMGPPALSEYYFFLTRLKNKWACPNSLGEDFFALEFFDTFFFWA